MAARTVVAALLLICTLAALATADEWPAGVALVLRGPSQYGKTTFLNSLLSAGQGGPLPTGDGSGESVTSVTASRQTRVGIVIDGPGDQDSMLRWSNEEIGSRFAVAVAAAGAGSMKFLLFESLAADNMQLRATMSSLVTSFGAQALRGALVIVTKPDLRTGPAAMRRLAAIRAAMAEQGVRELVMWQVGSDPADFDAQVTRLEQALSNVPGVPTSELQDLWTRTRRLAQELCDREPAKTKEVEVEVEVAVPYDEQETYVEQEPYTDVEEYNEQEPFTSTEEYTEQEPYTDDDQFVVHSTYVDTVEKEVEVPTAVATLTAWGSRRRTRLVKKLVKVPVEKVKEETRTRKVTAWRPVTKTRSVLTFRTVTKQRQVTKIRSVNKTRTVTKYRQENRTTTKLVEYLLSVESFMDRARAQILDEARRQFSSPFSYQSNESEL